MKSHKFFQRVYTDKETERLSEEYDIKTFSGYLPNTLEKVEAEIGAEKLLNLSKLSGEIIGIDYKDIENMIEDDIDFECIGWLNKEYVRTKKKGKLEILFPTEELLISQGVKRK